MNETNHLLSTFLSYVSESPIGERRLREAEGILCADLGALEVKFLDGEGQALHGATKLGNAFRQADSILIRLPGQPVRPSEQREEYDDVDDEREEILDEDDVEYVDEDDDGVEDAYDDEGDVEYEEEEDDGPQPGNYVPSHDQRGGYPPPRDDRFGPPPAHRPVYVREEVVRDFIREFDRLERLNRFMWAGFVVKELLPRFGIAGPDARRWLREIEIKRIVATSKEPNPRNPAFPTTRVTLNRSHPMVRSSLRDAPRPQPPSSPPPGNRSYEPDANRSRYQPNANSRDRRDY